MARTLLLGARLLDAGPIGSGAAALEVEDGLITWAGDPDAAGERRPGATVLELDGAVVTPAFVDAHVHATAAGLLADGLDLTGCGSARHLLDAVAARVAQRPGALVWGHGWQDQLWPDELPSRAALDRAASGAPVYLSRIDVHSALASSTLLDRAPGVSGAVGWSQTALSADAHHRVRRAALAAVDTATRDAAQTAFLTDAAARGVAVVHECAGPDISSAEDLAALRTRPGPEVVGYWGEAVGTAAEAEELLAATGAHGLAGDLFVDGSIGSRTAALRAPYADAPGCTGNRYLDATAIGAHVSACTGAGVQAGFHVIGDAGADALLAGLEAAVVATSAEAVRAAGHRVEHLEMVEPVQVRRLAELGVVASVQPLFDAFWGGPHGMYATRLGTDRARDMNPFAGLLAAGVELALGSDAPVTPVGPWAAIRAAMAHRTPASAITAAQALAAHTVGGHRAAGDRAPLAGRLLPGAAASYAIWDGAGPLDGSGTDPRCLRLVHRGAVLHDALAATIGPITR
ncbi:amidohydrolase [Pseudonocardia zijingensis]|uniref:amidohydrolase n=2 Tax=Pseudonocardia zijingensis TaxID=153376 RepID=UPI00360E8E65